jgi:thiol-disulfide isomerase/thioredoxin
VQGLAAALLVVATVSGGASELPTVSGGTFSVSEFLARGPGVLVFWNSWLPRSEEFAKLIPEVEAAARQHSWPGAVVIFQDQNQDAASQLSGGKAAFPLVLDRRGELVRRFKVTRAPTVLLVDPDGSVRLRSGPDPSEVRQMLQGMANR